jgi:hypothetical protein
MACTISGGREPVQALEADRLAAPLDPLDAKD